MRVSASRANRSKGIRLRPGRTSFANRIESLLAIARQVAGGLLKGGFSIILLAIAASALLALYAKVESIRDPRQMYIVQPLEISNSASEQLHITGKNASDYFTDELNQLVSDGAGYHGNSYSATNGLPMRDLPKIPVQTSYGITLDGVPVDAVIAVYQHLRYNQVAIGGDIVPLPTGGRITIRWTSSQNSAYAERVSTSELNPEEALQSLAREFLERNHPELAGQAYLQEKKYQFAVRAYTRWANNEPRNWRPTLYLAKSLSSLYDQLPQDQKELSRSQMDEDTVLLTDWAKGYFTSTKCPRQYSDPPAAGLWWAKTKAFLSGKKETTYNDNAGFQLAYQRNDDMQLPSTEASERRSLASDAATENAQLVDKYPQSSSYRTNLGVDYEQLARTGGGNDYFSKELTEFQIAHALDPGNAGIERNLGVALLNLAPIQPKDSQLLLCTGLQHEVTALHLSLDLPEAVDVGYKLLNQLQDSDGKTRFTRVASLLMPGSSQVRQIHMAALISDSQVSKAIDVASEIPTGQSDLIAAMSYLASTKELTPSLGLELATKSRTVWPNDPTIATTAAQLVTAPPSSH